MGFETKWGGAAICRTGDRECLFPASPPGESPLGADCGRGWSYADSPPPSGYGEPPEMRDHLTPACADQAA